MTSPTSEPRSPLAEFIHSETTAGVVLVGATMAALVWANLSPSSYAHAWATTLGPSWLHLHLDLQAWVNDGLMAVFFFVVGLEIKRELVVGELNTPRQAAMPVIAALGGMAVPALLYTALNAGGDGAHGWGIPMATDIAFVLGALSLLGSRAPTGLRLFLLTVAIVDDIGAIIVIALFYSGHVKLLPLAAAAAVLLAVAGMRRARITSPVAYICPAIVLWWLVYDSGVHATIAGVALALLTPARPVDQRPVLDALQHRLHPLSALLVVPLFALANAGIVLRNGSLPHAAVSAVGGGVILGLVVGKPLGISGAALAARTLGVGALPADVHTAHLLGGAVLAGIGFTVSLFIAELSFHGTGHLAEAKIGILAASIVAATSGSMCLARLHRHTRQSPPKQCA